MFTFGASLKCLMLVFPKAIPLKFLKKWNSMKKQIFIYRNLIRSLTIICSSNRARQGRKLALKYFLRNMNQRIKPPPLSLKNVWGWPNCPSMQFWAKIKSIACIRKFSKQNLFGGKISIFSELIQFFSIFRRNGVGRNSPKYLLSRFPPSIFPLGENVWAGFILR